MDVTIAGRTNKRPNKERYSYSANGPWTAEMSNNDDAKDDDDDDGDEHDGQEVEDLGDTLNGGMWFIKHCRLLRLFEEIEEIESVGE